MEYLVTGGEMRRCDCAATEKIGMPSMVLIERAALGAAEELCDGTFDLGRVLVVCTGGNNGADGLAVARLLFLKSVDVRILFVGDEEKCTPQARQQMKIVRYYGIPILGQADFEEYTTIVDALFGVGLSRATEGQFAEIISRMNCAKADVLSLDMPSGISADTGRVLGAAVCAKKTVTFGYKKLGLVLYPGAEHAGIVTVRDIGFCGGCFEGVYPNAYSYTPDDLKRLPARNPHSNKGTFGKVLAIAGSVNMSGAAYFSAKAAYRTGCGLVRIYTTDENREILQAILPEAVLTTYDCANIDADALKDAISWAGVIIAGPGLGKGAHAEAILEILFRTADVPLVVDADALNLLAGHPEWLDRPHGNIVLTPHLGEMSRLLSKSIPEIADDLILAANALAREKNAVCVLKDARTVVTDGSGPVYVNQSGNSGMATGGSGDVLTGIIAGLLSQGMTAVEAAALGVYVPGLAGDSASAKSGPYGVMAGDIVISINDVVR
jgi:NAD(P)H-hydrate epimerase